MNSGSEQKCSIEELKEKNLPPERHPTEKEWDDLLAILSALYRLTADQSDILKNSLTTMQAVHTRAEALTKDTVAIHQLLELSLPKIHLPRPRLAWLWVIPILVGVYALWPLWAILWNVVRPLLQQLP